MTPLQARETGGVCLRVSLHVVLQALDPRGLAEVTFLLLLRHQTVLLEDVVDAEVVLCPLWSRGLVHDHCHDLDGPALKGTV